MKVTSYKSGQAEGFSFTPDNLETANKFIARYPEGRQASAVIALLDLAQRQSGGWLPGAAIDYVANFLEIAPMRAFEVASFYSMFNLKPVGKHFIQVCRTTPCWLRGSDGLSEACKKKLGVKFGEVTEDGLFSVVEVECLGACANAPMVQINDDYYEDLTPERMAGMIDELREGKELKVGSQIGRLTSAPEGGMQTLTDLPPFDGKAVRMAPKVPSSDTAATETAPSGEKA
jgi:NADH-quinone oxidoreductase subunit E